MLRTKSKMRFENSLHLKLIECQNLAETDKRNFFHKFSREKFCIIFKVKQKEIIFNITFVVKNVIITK